MLPCKPAPRSDPKNQKIDSRNTKSNSASICNCIGFPSYPYGNSTNVFSNEKKNGNTYVKIKHENFYSSIFCKRKSFPTACCGDQLAKGQFFFSAKRDKNKALLEFESFLTWHNCFNRK